MVTPEPCAGPCLSRRHLLAVPGAVGAAALAACSSPADPGADQPTSTATARIANTGDIPVGGAITGTAGSGQSILLTQPTEGDVHALSSVCTHAGCAVEPDGTELRCPCHGSTFDLTGQRLAGPAVDPLPEIPITIADDGTITG